MQSATISLEGLNDVQRQAVLTTDGPVQIIAGAGSGKTRVLTHRVAYLLGEKRIHPWNILAITFTNKAAKEMKERISALIGSMAQDIWVSTFHSMCVRILRKNIDRIGYANSFTILDTADQLSVIKQILKEENLDPKKFEPRNLLFQISQAKNQLIDVHAFRSSASGFMEQIAAQVYERYQQKLRTNESLDFDDLLMVTVNLFQQVPDVLDYYQKKFQYIHVDEYQDTNHAQYLLMKLLAEGHKNICVVGDSDQSIYRFRGADIQNILRFEQDYPNAKVIKLEQNYRSTKHILEVANQIIANNTERRPKNLWTDKEEGEKISLFVAENEQEEAYFIVDTIARLSREGKAYQDFAILYRTNAQSRVLEEFLLKANVPYQVVGGIKFYERKEIKDILAYLRVVVNPHDDISLERIINVPRRGIGATTMDKIRVHAANEGVSLFSAILEVDYIGLSKRTKDSLTGFVQMIQAFHGMADYLSAVEMTEEILSRAQYREEYKKEKTIEAQARLENIDEFISVAKEFENRNDDKSILALLTELALVAEVDNDPVETDTVSLMTVHSAKGLEFPHVFIVGMEENIFPHSRSLEDEVEMEEERRLAYVAVTRAEEMLYLSRARSRTLYGFTSMNTASRFLAEISPALLQEIGKTNPRVEKRIVNRPTPRPVGVWTVGDQVNHKKWGIGTVVKVDGEELNIAFPAPVGVKKLLAQFAPIEKI
ncbi:DNA helicase PcrA [Shimazuella alba]|uniref:ATP-dependent DNA helicase n=1 Tax=Shimazuella alba TaxID=2690964 RepID=A0A6I4VTW4_9BACL|nr:DNA helicase PcrA [Shimazuella alba]